MSKTLYENATHRKGPMLFDGSATMPSELERLKKDLDLEVSRTLMMRSSVFEPSKTGIPGDDTNFGGVYGNGFKIGAGAPGHINYSGLGPQKDGSYDLVNDGVGTLDNLSIVGPPAFEVAATKDLKFYFKGSIGDVTATDFFCGMSHDNVAAVNNFPDVLSTATGVFIGVDGIGFLKPDAAASADMTFAVWDANVSTNSTQTVTFPATISDGTTFECGFIVSGVTSITVFMKVGSAETVQLITRVSGSILDELAADLLKMGPAVGMRVAGATVETVTINAMAATQPL